MIFSLKKKETHHKGTESTKNSELFKIINENCFLVLFLYELCLPRKEETTVRGELRGEILKGEVIICGIGI